MRIRRALALILHWDQSHFHVHNFLSGKVARLNPELVALLDAFRGYVHVAAINELSSVSGELIQRLLDNDILVVEGSDLAKREEALFSKWQWDISAKHYHFATNSVQFESNDESVWEALELKSKSEPPPSPFREFAGKYLPLPRPERLTMRLEDALILRRTCRDFTAKPVTLSKLATVLGLTWGVTAIAPVGQALGDFVLKTSPSGGARHPTEVYVFAARVRGLQPGIYHYSPRLHALLLLRDGDPSRLAAHLCAGQAWVADAAATFFMTSLVSRSMWKYSHSHAYRVLLLDAGHLGQTFHLVCTAMGLGPFTTAAFDGFAVEQALSLDGISEIVIYASAMGWPNTEVSASTLDIKHSPSTSRSGVRSKTLR